MIFHKDLSLYRAYESAAQIVGNETAIFYFDSKISFNRLSHIIDKWASILQNDFNIQKGDSVLIALPNIPQTIILFYAVNKIGGICNMVHPYNPKETIQKYYDESHCKVAFLFDGRVIRELKQYKAFEGNIVICDMQAYLLKYQKWWMDLATHAMNKTLRRNTKFTFYRDFKYNENGSVEVPLTDEDTAVLLHSASTTGIAKTIKLSARSFNFTASKVPEIMCMTEDEFIGKAMISVLPSFHGFGLCMTMHAPLANRFGVALIPKYSPSNLTKMMKKCKCAISICGVPSIFKTLLNEPTFYSDKHYVKMLRSCFCGGDSLPSNIKEHFDTLMIRRKSPCRLYEGYGLTEALSVCAVNTHRRHKIGSVGYPVSGVEFKIFDDNNKELGPGEIGEISIKSSNNMLGYYNNEEATKETYFGEYLKTGDMGYIDEDGYIFYTSRKKRVIKVSGIAVFPHEVEEVISHIPGVKGVCAIQIPDENTGHAVKVFVMSVFRDPNVIMDECRKHLISWSLPKEIEFVNNLPYTKYKKVDFNKLQKQENEKRGISS